MTSQYNETETTPLLDDNGAPKALVINTVDSPGNTGVVFSHGTHEHKINSRFAVWNLFNDILSPGTVALPLYIYQSGLASGSALLVLFALLTGYTLEDIYILYMKYGKKNYPELCEHVFGLPGYALVCIAIFCFNFGGLCAQLMLFGTVAPDILVYLFGPHVLFTKTYLILLGSVTVFLPISFLKDIAKYTFTSFVSVSIIFIITFLVLFRLIDKHPGDYDPPDKGAYAIIHSTIFSALGGLAYIYVCHDLSFNIIGSLKNPTQRRYRRVVATAMLGTVASCALIGISGYLLFFDQVQSNILQSFPQKDLVATIGRILLAIDVTFTIPFSCFMPRVSIIAALSAVGPRAKKWVNSRIGFSCITVIVLFSAVLISIVVNDLGDVFELVGGVSACSLAFLFPPIIIMKQIGLKNLSLFRKVMTITTLICGILILVGSTTDILFL